MLMAYGLEAKMSFVGQRKWIGGGDKRFCVNWIGRSVFVIRKEIYPRERERERERERDKDKK